MRRKSKSESKYESPLNVFKKSLEELTGMVSNIVYKNRRLTRGMLKKLKEENDNSSKESSRNSVIVISDSDSETVDENNDNKTNDGDDKDTSLCILESRITKPSSSLRQRRKSRISAKRNINGSSSVVILDDDTSGFHLSDIQESLLNEENIAPTQTGDDVVELWSCMKKSNAKNERRKIKKFNKKNTMYKIDKIPNPRYFKYLETNAKLEEKKRKRDLSCYKTTSESFIKLKQKKARKRRHNNNSNLSPTTSNAHHDQKRINLDEENSQTISTHRLREIVVDGCNVAMAYTNGKGFSEKGIQIVVDYFKLRGHIVKVFLPQHVRKKERTFLEQLYKEGTVIFTPSRNIDGRRITSYDDRFILKYATLCGGVVISMDQYRDLYQEKPEWRNTILNRLLMPTFVGDCVMFPDDPLGRFGPNLETFLRY